MILNKLNIKKVNKLDDIRYQLLNVTCNQISNPIFNHIWSGVLYQLNA